MQKNCETKAEEPCSVVTKCLKANTPIRLKVVPELGCANVECGTPKICFFSKPFCCSRNSCEFIVEQTIMVEIPIRYFIKADVGESYIDCAKPV